MPIGLEDRLINNASGFSIAGAIDNDIRGIYWVANTGARDLIGDANVNNSDLRSQYVICIVGSTPYIYTSPSIADVDWTNTSNWQEFALGDLTALTSQVNTNAGNIATNTGSISTNTTNISTNASSISVNAGDISTNAVAISQNATDISQLQTDLASEATTRATEDATLLGQIQSNDSDIVSLQSSVTSNSGAISTNTTNISTNATGISTNAANITINTNDISALDAATVKYTDSIDSLSDVDTTTSTPTDGQILTWNQGNSEWRPEDAPVGGIVLIDAKNNTGAFMPKGTPVYVSGYNASSGKPEISAAAANGVNTYPAIGVLNQDVSNGDEGLIVTAGGSIAGLNTNAYSIGAALYLSNTAGVFTTTKPTGTSVIQKVALVTRVDGSNGSIIVMGAGRTNDVPNLNNGDIFIGNGSNQAITQSLNTAVNSTSVFTSLLGSVGVNTTNIATNASNISNNDTDITNLDGRVTTLEGVGAEANVQSDWTETNSGLDSFILNKPTLGTAAAADTSDFAPAVHTHVAANITDFDTEVSNNTDVTANTAKVSADGSVTTHSDVTNAGSGAIITGAERTKLNGIATGATANQTDAYLLNRANHTGTQTASTISDFDTEVSNNTDVVANTAKNSYPAADASKLAGIAAGAEVNVQADWNEANTGSDAYIQNKPTAVADLTQHWVEVELPSIYLKGGASVMDFNNASPTLVTNLSQTNSIGSAITWSNNKFTVNADGLYTFNISGNFNTIGIERAQPTFYFYLNGSQVEGAGGSYLRNTGDAFDGTSNLTRTFNLTANDYVEVYVENTGRTTPGTAVRANGIVFEVFSHEMTVVGVNGTGFILNDSNVAAQPLRQYYASTANFPSATTWHGAIAHSHADGAMYFAHGGSWVKLGNDSDIFDGDYNSLINQPNIPVVGTDAQAHDANLTAFVNAFTLPTTDGSNGQVLTTNGSGTLSFASSGGSGSTTLLGLTDTPATFGSTGQVLAVNALGNAVEFVNQSGGSGSSNKRTLLVPSTNDYSGDVVTFGGNPSSGSFVAGALYYYDGANWELAYGTAQQTSTGLLGLCVNTTTPELLVRGIITNSNLGTQLTSGSRLYVSALQGGTGKMMDSVPSTPLSGSVLRAVGYVINGANSQVMFDPSQDFITFP